MSGPDFIAHQPDETPARRVAVDLLNEVAFEEWRRAGAHRNCFHSFWSHGSATPDEILEAMGTDAARWLAVAGLSVRQVDEMARVRGRDVTDVLAPEDFTPPRAFVVHGDGSVTLE